MPGSTGSVKDRLAAEVASYTSLIHTGRQRMSSYMTGFEYPSLDLVKRDGEPVSVCRYFYKLYANDWQVIEAVLRQSSKYFIEHLRHRCLS